MNPFCKVSGLEGELAMLVPTNHPKVPLSELLSIVIESVGRFSGGGPPHDDVTLVLARAR
jgi:serine phosphatase RsbU (regulator of sigma subunit)